jgi:hypothetical protein
MNNSLTNAEWRALLERSSLGGRGKNDYLCTGPSFDHRPSDDAVKAKVKTTRCLACHMPIRHHPHGRGWKAYDRPDYHHNR